jgi:ubiquinone/menaquinone biosynthesis C-methylase UbiE
MNSSSEGQFNQVARAYATSAVHAHGPDLEWLVAALRPQADWKVLDAGCGAGHAALAVAAYVEEVIAVDVADKMLQVAADLAADRGVSNLNPVLSSVGNMPFLGGSFDAAITRFSTHHWPDPRADIAEIARVLRTGAPFVLIDAVGLEDTALDTFLNTLELLRDPSHVRNATITQWSLHLANAGFAVDSIKRWDVRIDTAEWLARSSTVEWRQTAVKHLLQGAPAPARTALSISSDCSSFSLPCAMITARLESSTGT